MHRLFFLFVILIALGPFLTSVYLNSQILKTERFNLQRSPTFIELTPLNSISFTFEAQENFLSQIRIFIHCPDPIFPWNDHYLFLVQNYKTGEEYASFDLRPIDFWDDVAKLKFAPITNSVGQVFKVTIEANLSNASVVQWASSVANPGEIIFQPYYEQDTPFFEALYIILWDRLSWRSLLVVPLFFSMIFYSKKIFSNFMSVET